MKRILLFVACVAVLASVGFSQSKSAQDNHKAQAVKKAKKEEAKRGKEVIKKSRKVNQKTASEIHKNTGLNKDGTPDMRLAINKQKAEAEARKIKEREARERAARERETRVSPQRQDPVHPRINPQPVNRTADRIVGTDVKGRTIYQGPRGGRYYINKNGNKEYIK